jgi:hypothetical protein
MKTLPPALKGMELYNQFVPYKIEPSKTRPGKFDKWAICKAGYRVNHLDPANQMSFQEAVDLNVGDGIGFIITKDDPFFFVDIDGAYNDSQWSPLAARLCELLSGAAVEVSQSGTGLHIFGTYNGDVEHACKNKEFPSLELYTELRFAALTGTSTVGDVNCNVHDAFKTVVDNYYPSTGEDGSVSSDWTTTHREGSYPIEDDAKLIAKACDSKSNKQMFGAAITFKDLWEGNEEELIKHFPDDDSTWGKSNADAALAQHLSFWTGGNCERIERLMRQSALKRDKWDEHKTYLNKFTIPSAVGRSKNFYDVGKPIKIVEVELESCEPIAKDGYQVMASSQQLDHFRHYVYVTDVNRILTPTGEMLKSEQFNVVKGGYSFAVDHGAERTVKKAWEAFTESQLYEFPKVWSTQFYPEVEPGKIIVEEGRRFVNTYIPVDVPQSDDDVTPFLTHVAKLLPCERDQEILISYMAALVQHKGYKFKWAPVIQGTKGNGKSALIEIMEYVISERYTHQPRADEIGEKFNDWQFDKLFIAVEEVKISDGNRNLLEVLKTMVTQKRAECRKMGVDKFMRKVCSNYMFLTNYQDAMLVDNDERRWCMMFTAQQEKAHLLRDGMDGEYFNNFFNWLRREGGFAAVAGYLNRYQISKEFDPKGHCERAPDTSSTVKAVKASLGSVEQEILEAIDEGRPGFIGGWVSSFQLDKLIDDMRKGNQIPRNKRKALMESLGYHYHPNLIDGRVNNSIAIDEGKPRLFVKKGHLLEQLQTPAEIANRYAADQGDPFAKISLDAQVNKN